MADPTIPWACLECPAHGLTTSTESGADAKHVAATGHGTTTTLTGADL